jgi:hypothetical protein
MFFRASLFLVLSSGLLAIAGSVHAQSLLADEPAGTGGYSQSSHAESSVIDRSEVESMVELVDSLLEAIGRLSSYDRPGTAPRISRISRAEIERTLCGGPCAVKAWYLPGEGIFLDDSLAPETNLVHRSILFHELVHFVQDVNGEADSMDPCHRWLHREREAYDLQNQYLARIGDKSSYMLMLSNQSWLAGNRHVCSALDRPAEADSGPQVFRDDEQTGLHRE